MTNFFGQKLSKTHLCLTLDPEIIAELKKRKENISALTNSLLASYLNLDTPEKAENKIKELREDYTNKKVELLAIEQKVRFLESMEQKKKEEYEQKIKTGEIIVYDGTK